MSSGIRNLKNVFFCTTLVKSEIILHYYNCTHQRNAKLYIFIRRDLELVTKITGSMLGDVDGIRQRATTEIFLIGDREEMKCIYRDEAFIERLYKQAGFRTSFIQISGSALVFETDNHHVCPSSRFRASITSLCTN